jgi:hypothetical protein
MVEQAKQSRRFFSMRIPSWWLTLPLLLVMVLVGCTVGARLAWFDAYQPQEGDLVFQSLPNSELVVMIEGATQSPWSHVGMVVKEGDDWYVYEAIGPVKKTPLVEYVKRSRGGACAVYRLKEKFQKNIPQMIKASKKYKGRPYDSRYRMDDELIYCSELVYKSYKDATGKGLGKLVSLGELNWKPYEKSIRKLEGGPPPLDRKMITPRDLAKAVELKLVTSHGVKIE